MKFFTVFVALLSVAFGYQGTWTLNQLSEALQNPSTDPALVPYLEHALNEMMDALFAGQQIATVSITIPAVDLSSWSLNDLSHALENPNTDPALVPYLEQALNQMMDALFAGQTVDAVSVVVPAMDVSSWTISELSDALQNPQTNPALVPYLEHALNDIMSALYSGQQIESIVVAVPAGLLPVDNPIISPMPVIPTPIEPSPVEVPVVPSPVENPAAPSSPLVQIIVNVNQASGPAPVPAVVPEVVPESVIVVEQPEVAPQPVIVVENPPVVPESVIVVENPSVVPEPVAVVETPAAPEPVIIATPEIPVNPIDVIAVMPNPIQVNPIHVVGPI